VAVDGDRAQGFFDGTSMGVDLLAEWLVNVYKSVAPVLAPVKPPNYLLPGTGTATRSLEEIAELGQPFRLTVIAAIEPERLFAID